MDMNSINGILRAVARPQLANTAFQAHPLVNRLNLA
jgi:hypothetical protein